VNTLAPMTYERALEILEDEDDRIEAMGEAWAEAGSGGVSMGYDGYESANAYMAEQGDRFAPHPQLSEAQAYLAEFPIVYLVTERGDQWGGEYGCKIIMHHPARKHDRIPF
jgi:hypothetical protein